ncbi:hypothetical protein [Legionella pneumophila]|nr:hypothetical protein [Legionella pneumophila]WBV70182.1 hypothetical protein PGH46_16005 [Legionella pneumophila]
MILKKYKPKKIIIYSRDEYKQFTMNQEFDFPCMRFFWEMSEIYSDLS